MENSQGGWDVFQCNSDYPQKIINYGRKVKRFKLKNLAIIEKWKKYPNP